MFLTFINAFIAFVLCLANTWNVKKILKRLQKERVKIYFVDILLSIPVRACIVLIISCVVMIYMGFMLCYHLFLLNKDRTTIERKYKILKVNTKNKKKRSFKEKLLNMLHGNNWFDIYLPEYHLGIEFNGSYWHSDIFHTDHKGRSTYHQEKSLKAEEVGIFLFHIFEYE